ncbi:hypothetical protein L228DRAFT_268298 [Xylona heveae TC161]|uniref:Uncharacterized protein n=1 Tax=Xylona heveae (strain CBS 132557 / TC161) TaxID=1328760 RepID=A0A161TB99_XYLHT|nr:hypothetical protein L228DRAFT_268298 [Xylona heveae TC161]KZF22927.1 hypothetical protein L228DRAFT_268298 [Xylona heveae TC161]
MSIFSKLSSAKKAAEKHKSAQQAHEKAETTAPAPYKHIITHAAVDALSGAPSSWKNEDRQLIREHHRRRSAMIRNNSGLSSVSTLPRTSSYHGSAWNYRPSDSTKLLKVPSEQGMARSPVTSTDISPIASSSQSTTSDSSSSLEIQGEVHFPEQNVLNQLHKSTYRKVGEAPLYDAPPPRPKAQTNVSVTPIENKKRWRFSKSGPAPVAAAS